MSGKNRATNDDEDVDLLDSVCHGTEQILCCMSTKIAPGTKIQEVPEAEEDMLDQVFNGTEKACCSSIPSNPQGGNVAGKRTVYASEILSQKRQQSTGEETTTDEGSEDLAFGNLAVRMMGSIPCFGARDEDVLSTSSPIAYEPVKKSQRSSRRKRIQERKVRKKENRWRRWLVVVIVLLLIVSIAALTIGFLRSPAKNNQGASVSNLVESESSLNPATSAPSYEENLVATNSPSDDKPNIFLEVDSTDSPTRDPTALPSIAPSNHPTVPIGSSSPTISPVCGDTVSVNSLCYQYSVDPVVIDFTICSPKSRDWVALYPEGSDPMALGAPKFHWSFTCGSQNCDGAAGGKSFELTVNTPPGTYQAFLIPNEDGLFRMPYEAVAVSEVFTVTRGVC